MDQIFEITLESAEENRLTKEDEENIAMINAANEKKEELKQEEYDTKTLNEMYENSFAAYDIQNPSLNLHFDTDANKKNIDKVLDMFVPEEPSSFSTQHAMYGATGGDSSNLTIIYILVLFLVLIFILFSLPYNNPRRRNII
jgi:hypothetical protein